MDWLFVQFFIIKKNRDRKFNYIPKKKKIVNSRLLVNLTDKIFIIE